MQHILVIDDDAAVTSLLKRGLSYEGFAVATTQSGAEGLAFARENPVDLVILDVMMPGLDGFEVLRRLRAADAQLPILMLTAKDASTDQVQGLESGADDYVIKPFTFDILLARIHVLLRRKHVDHPAVLRFADLTLDTGSYTVHRSQREVSLTSLEFKVLREFLIHPQQVLSKEILLDRIWGYDFDENVVEVYVKQLRQKLEASGEARLIQTIRGAGYVLRTEG